MYISVGVGKNSGLIEGAIIPAVRKYYNENEDFKEFIDGIKPEDFENIIEKKAMKDMKNLAGQSLTYDRSLFDEDLCVTIQNILQAPSRINTLYSVEDIENLFYENGFTELRRLNRYVMRQNIRKYLAPFHYDKEHPVSKILYGEGYIEYIAHKK